MCVNECVCVNACVNVWVYVCDCVWGSRQKCEVEEDPSVLPLFLEPALWVICYYLS